MVEQTKILEHDADAPPERRQIVLAQRRGVPAEYLIVPRVGRSDSSISRIRVVLPAPDGPVRN